MWKYARQLVKQAEGIIAPDPSEVKGPTHGFRVLHVDADSPAARVGVEALFDYIIAVNGQPLLPMEPQGPVAVQAEEAPVINLIRALQIHSPAALTLWSAKGKTTRTVQVPVKLDSSRDAANPDFDLGISVQWYSLEVADYVWHVLNITPGSAAEEAGLISHADYIVGAEDGLLEAGGEGLLSTMISRASENPTGDGSVGLIVYNHDYDTTRPVRIVPRVDAHGHRVLGFAVGYGLLHRLPVVERRRRVSITGETHLMPPGQTLYDAEGSGGSIVEEGSVLASSPGGPATFGGFVPGAPAPGFAPPPMAGPPPKGRARAHHSHAPPGAKTDLSAYFDEQTSISREVDGWKPTSGVAPPPPKKN